jgi:hypothetical protein
MGNKDKPKLQWIETVAGTGCWLLLLSALIATFYKSSHPGLGTYAKWVFGIFLAIPIAGIAAWVLFSIGYGAYRMWKLYQECIASSNIGIARRIFWAVWFILSFIIALFFVRF